MGDHNLARHDMARNQDYNADLALVRGMAAGDTGALDALYARHGPAILSFLVARLYDRQAAEEVLQDVMLAAWHSAADFRGDSSVRTWLLVIARNRAINMHRKRKLPIISFSDALEAQATDTEPLERVARKARHAAVREALDHLPAPQREVLTLAFFHHLSGPEIAEVLDIEIGTVKSRLHRAKDALRRVLSLED
jgi:RNA polymerase sigma-70 factor (ECF subfamily)